MENTPDVPVDILPKSDAADGVLINGSGKEIKAEMDPPVEQPELSDAADAGGQGITAGGGIVGNVARMSVTAESAMYNMGHTNRGYCVIFNHKLFHPSLALGERNGTDRDRDQIQQLFLTLGFQVIVHNDLTVARIKEVIQDVAYEIDHSDCDCLVIVFMSHGEQDILFGCDGSFRAENIFDHFRADLCPKLAGKPKLFFIQACRGDGLDAGVTLTQTQPRDETDSDYLAYKIPTTADFLVCWSTVPGHFSWRNTTNGSWFIQSLVSVFQRDAHFDDVLSMMTSVNRHMIVNFESNCPSQVVMHGKKQASCTMTTLMRKVYLRRKF